ncbi:MAG: hypothetical protein KBT20_00395 [Bacteroidales bacterium]|nr:hypothetical protein [Candidatus Liminaster caballi]
MKKISFLFCIVCALILTSCGSTKQARVFRPNNIQLNVGMGDLEYLGDCQISVSYDKYLGVFTKINKVNGEDYSSLEHSSADIQPFSGALSSGPIELAAFKVLEDYPTASYFMPVCQTTTTTKLFLGREITKTATIRVYSFKK